MSSQKTFLAVFISMVIQFGITLLIYYLILDNITVALIAAGITSLILTFIQIYFANTIVIKNVQGHASTLNKAQKLQEKLAYFAAMHDITTPQLYIITTRNVNSVSVGKSKNHSYVCITEGALVALSMDELSYLLKYEVNKIMSGETAFNTIVLATLGYFMIIYDKFRRSINKSVRARGKESESIMRILLTALFNIFSPLVMWIIHLFIPKYYDIQNDMLTNSQFQTNSFCIDILNVTLDANSDDEDSPFASSNAFFVNPLFFNKMFFKMNHHTDINNRIEYLEKN